MQAHASLGSDTRQAPVVGLFENGMLTPSPVACPEQSRREPATGRLCRLSTQRLGPLGWTARMANLNQLRRFVSRGWQASAIWRGARYFVYNRRLMLSQEPAE